MSSKQKTKLLIVAKSTFSLAHKNRAQRKFIKTFARCANKQVFPTMFGDKGDNQSALGLHFSRRPKKGLLQV